MKSGGLQSVGSQESQTGLNDYTAASMELFKSVGLKLWSHSMALWHDICLKVNIAKSVPRTYSVFSCYTGKPNMTTGFGESMKYSQVTLSCATLFSKSFPPRCRIKIQKLTEHWDSTERKKFLVLSGH